MASDEPLGDRQAEPDAPVLRRVPQPLERHEQRVPVLARHARTAVDDSYIDDPVDDAGGDAGPPVGRREADGVLDHVGERALEQSGVGEDGQQRLVHVEVDGAVGETDAMESQRRQGRGYETGTPASRARLQAGRFRPERWQDWYASRLSGLLKLLSVVGSSGGTPISFGELAS
jgi:hypothetical protein